MPRFFPSKTHLLTAISVLFVSNIHAATVSWSSSLITDPTDVRTDGTLLYAYDLGPGGKIGSTVDPIVNGVAFQSQSLGAVASGAVGNLSWITTGGTFGNASPDYVTDVSGLDAAYLSLLSDGFSIAGSVGAAAKLTLGGLTAGQEYVIQMWFNDSRSGKNIDTIVYETADSSNSITVKRNSSSSAGTLGSWVTGEFVADGTGTLNLTLSGGTYVGINALQIRAIPEPSTYALGLAGIAGIALAVSRRKRSR